MRIFTAALALALVLAACAVPASAPAPESEPPLPAPRLDSPQLPARQRAVSLPHTLWRQPAAQRRAAADALPPVIEEICIDHYVAGMSLVVFDAWGPFYRQSCGWAAMESGRYADENTVYRIASISKTVTAMLALDLAGQGKLDLDGDLTAIMGTPVRNPAFPDTPVTPTHLLTHTAGIVDGGAYEAGITSNPIRPLSTVVPYSFAPWAPGTRYSYSNLGMGMMSGVVETAAGERFLDYTREEIFAPMGIDAGYSYDSIRDKDRVANIYAGSGLSVYMPSWLGGEKKYTALPLGQLYGLGHGDLFISAGDLTRFARILAGCPQPGEPVELTPELLERMQTVQYEEEPTAESYTEIKRGLGTHITDCLVPGRRMVGHQGNAYGSICGMFVDPADHTGFVFLTSGAWAGKDEAGLYYVNREIARAVYAAFFTPPGAETPSEDALIAVLPAPMIKEAEAPSREEAPAEEKEASPQEEAPAPREKP